MPPMTIRKSYGHSVSVLKGTNKIIACSKVDWSPVKTGSIIAIDGDKDFYKIIEKDKSSYYKDVEVLNSSQLKVTGHTGQNLSINDSITFTNDEYEAESVVINSAGEGYHEGDIILPQGGKLRYNSIDEIDQFVMLEVESTNEDGGVEELSIKSAGAYNVSPSKTSIKGGQGNGLKISVVYKHKDKRTTEDRSISEIEYKEDHTVIYLSHELPPRVQRGSISATKWEVYISAPYLGENKYDVGYEIYKDFTPNLNIPVIRGNMAANYMLYNEGMMIIDKKIKELEDKINSL